MLLSCIERFPPSLIAFVAHCEMWCVRIRSAAASTHTGINLLDSLVAAFHKTSGGVVKPFADAEPWTEGSVQQQQHGSFTLPTNLKLLSNWYPFPKTLKNQAWVTVLEQKFLMRWQLLTAYVKRSESSVLFSDRFLRTVPHEPDPLLNIPY